MKVSYPVLKPTLIVSVLLVWTAAISAQESHVQVRYEKSIDRTMVDSDVLYVVNQPTQFMQIQLRGRYPGKGKASQLPDRLSLEFYSFAPTALYQPDSKHRLLVKVDDKVRDFGLLSYSKVDGQNKEAKAKSNPKPPKTNLELSVTLPDAAVVASTHKNDELTLELLSLSELSLADLKLFANANDLAMKIGDTVFRFRPMQAAIVREFFASVSPPNADELLAKQPLTERMPADVPSDENQMPLPETLAWLKAHMEHNSATNDILTPKRFEPEKFVSCDISYRLTPLIRTSPVSATLVNPIVEYAINLADLNSEAVRVSDVGDYVMVSFTARDYQPKIKRFTRANDSGTTGRTLDDDLTESATIDFKTKAAALQFKTAFAHAINQCHAQH